MRTVMHHGLCVDAGAGFERLAGPSLVRRAEVVTWWLWLPLTLGEESGER